MHSKSLKSRFNDFFVTSTGIFWSNYSFVIEIVIWKTEEKTVKKTTTKTRENRWKSSKLLGLKSKFSANPTPWNVSEQMITIMFGKKIKKINFFHLQEGIRAKRYANVLGSVQKMEYGETKVSCVSVFVCNWACGRFVSNFIECAVPCVIGGGVAAASESLNFYSKINITSRKVNEIKIKLKK